MISYARIDMAADMVKALACQHVAMSMHAMWHMRVPIISVHD